MIKLISNYPKVIDECYWEFSEDYYKSIESDFINHPGDGSRNINFNHKLYNLIGKDGAYILDIGCGWGESVEDFINDHHIGIGLDGYPLFVKYSKFWHRFPNNFFVCDIGKPFFFEMDEELLLFDVITSWECFEHIKTKDINQVICNINNCSKLGTIFICSIGKTEENVHRTIKNRNWWLKKFEQIGFQEKEMNFGCDLVRNLGNISHYFFMIKTGI